MMSPPRAPVPRMGAAAFVMIASGRLSKMPMDSPMAQPGQGRRIFRITNPMANRAMNAPSMAARLSGKLMGIMRATLMPPKIKPQSAPNEILDIVPILPTWLQHSTICVYLCNQAYGFNSYCFIWHLRCGRGQNDCSSSYRGLLDRWYFG